MSIDEPGEMIRKKALINELNLRRYSEKEALIAQEWILRGGPARYGKLTLADFYPDSDQLGKIDLDRDHEKEKREAKEKGESEGYRKGYDVGYVQGRKEVAGDKAGPMFKPLSDEERIDYERLKGMEEEVVRLEEQRRQQEAKDAKRKRRERFTNTGFGPEEF